MNTKKDVIIVGAGASGIGTGIVLGNLGIDFLILEQGSVASSFKQWPAETRFITPSFTGNFFGMPDLNAISPLTSPAFNLLTEHPVGEDYAEYLEGVARHYELPIEENTCVTEVVKSENGFNIQTNRGEFRSTFVIWAGGEYQYPDKETFEGREHCLHYSGVESFSQLQGEEFLVIGAYESGFDAAVNLANLGKKVTLLDRSENLEYIDSDSSYSLTPYTRDRIEPVLDKINYCANSPVIRVEFDGSKYTVICENKQESASSTTSTSSISPTTAAASTSSTTPTSTTIYTSMTQPINCTGFDSSLSVVQSLFEFKNTYPLLSEYDESVRTENLFLVGPQVKHSEALFCFIYKYRQRFAIVAEQIAGRLNISRELTEEVIDEHREYNFYMSDLSCCDNECSC